jgi:hypothetical protein
MLLDGVFGAECFRNEIIWKRTSGHSDAVGFGSIHDVVLFYTRDARPVWNDVFQPYDDGYIEQYYRYKDPDGRRWMSDNLSASGLSGGGYDYEWKGITRVWRCPRSTMERLDAEGKIFYTRNGIARRKRYLDEAKGIPAQDLWTDIQALRSWHDERLGYPTQKPVALLERIIRASSNPGDVVLDPFCGCGTTIHAAQKLGRQWIGIDITYLAINLIKRRLKDAFGEEIEFEEKGQPTDFAGATQLAENDKFQFQHWALSLIGARPLKEGDGKGADRGVDGLLYFYETERKDLINRIKEDAPAVRSEPVHREKIIVQVKGGGVNRGDVATLLGDVENQKAAGGVLITLEKASKPMREEASDAGRYTSKLWHDKDYPRLQILTIEGLLNGTERIDAPPQLNPFAMAARESTPHKQTEMTIPSQG